MASDAAADAAGAFFQAASAFDALLGGHEGERAADAAEEAAAASRAAAEAAAAERAHYAGAAAEGAGRRIRSANSSLMTM